MSLIDIEQNDVDISKLFEYRKELKLITPSGDSIILHQRLVGDEYNNQGRIRGLREASKLRENLRNRRWEDRSAYIPPIHKYKKDEVIENILSLIIGELTLTAINNTQIPIPKKPDGDATLEEQEKYQKAVDNYREKFNEVVTENVEKEVERRRTGFKKYTKDKLIELYESSLINDHVRKRSLDFYYEFVTYHGTFIDENFTKRITKTFEEFQDLPSPLKREIIESYKNLEISSVELKK